MNDHGQNDHTERERDSWGSKAEFILSCMGYGVGVGTIWRFPYLCYRNGGAAFLIPYLTMLVLCGIPLFFIEISLGQFASTGCISVFQICPLFKGAGYAMVSVNFIVSAYFNMICAYPLVFLINCFHWQLPWSNCNNPWNTEMCTELTTETNITSLNRSNYISQGNVKTPADEFFHNEVLRISDNILDMGGIVWPVFFCNIVAWVIVYLCIMKGVKSVGKVVYVTATLPFIVLFVFVIRGVTLPGAWDGIYFYIVPQWDQLINLRVWAEAAMQIFFSLGPGWGGLISMASFNDFRYNYKMDAVIVPLISAGTSILAGFSVFSVIGYIAHMTNRTVATVTTSGPGLVFITFPEATSLLPMPHLWAALFFIMLFFIGLDNLFVFIEGIINGIVDEIPMLKKRRSLVTLVTVLTLAVLSIVFTTQGGMYWLQLFDWYASPLPVVTICIVEIIIIGWIYGVDKFTHDVELMINQKISKLWKLSWKITTPAILICIFVAIIAFNERISYNDAEYPDWVFTLGWDSCAFSILLIPLHMAYRLLYLQQGPFIERIKSSLSSKQKWGPARQNDKVDWAIHSLQKFDLGGTINRNDPMYEQYISLTTFKE